MPRYSCRLSKFAIVGDDEVGLGRERAGEHVVVVQITAGRGRQRLWLDDLGQASIRRRGGPCQSRPDKAVLVSATIRMAGASLGARRGDFSLDFFRGEGRQVQRIELGDVLAESLGGRIASPLLAGLEEVDEVLHLCALLRRQRF
jgi:hypothetical protein